MWAGKVKHRLKTAEGTSVVELFNVSVMVPEELMEQMPPTLFVSTLAGQITYSLSQFLLFCWSAGTFPLPFLSCLMNLSKLMVGLELDARSQSMTPKATCTSLPIGDAATIFFAKNN